MTATIPVTMTLASLDPNDPDLVATVGGKGAGMSTCWLALEGEDEPVGLVEPDYTITSLGELPRLVL